MKTTGWYLAILPFLVLGAAASFLHVLSWPLALLAGVGTGATISRYESTSKLGFTRPWPAALVIVFVGITLGGLPVWTMFWAGSAGRTLFAFGSAVTAALYEIGLGLGIAYMKFKGKRTNPP